MKTAQEFVETVTNYKNKSLKTEAKSLALEIRSIIGVPAETADRLAGMSPGRWYTIEHAEARVTNEEIEKLREYRVAVKSVAAPKDTVKAKPKSTKPSLDLLRFIANDVFNGNETVFSRNIYRKCRERFNDVRDTQIYNALKELKAERSGAGAGWAYTIHATR